jgi:hypothetical protein
MRRFLSFISEQEYNFLNILNIYFVFGGLFLGTMQLLDPYGHEVPQPQAVVLGDVCGQLELDLHGQLVQVQT